MICSKECHHDDDYACDTDGGGDVDGDEDDEVVSLFCFRYPSSVFSFCHVSTVSSLQGLQYRTYTFTQLFRRMAQLYNLATILRIKKKANASFQPYRNELLFHCFSPPRV